ncbi:ABC transporter [Paenibacillus sp. FSL R7-0273]|uniref:ABC transporter ATP-binding protein n=1 Tax=Paenibacillus sp. FSL R7-0273 TaxID=1536772 RepID=UPI0004F7C7ED|nr:ABC transporter ATP-binding protein [Paenibacillus sp. FSL R7-0273]AIQ46946.1 ABC transporter [Paenibacillus sp. FSL R7-0273]OMF97296.1 ABC transporter [Paenibacillus sp. FSL R7-0273]
MIYNLEVDGLTKTYNGSDFSLDNVSFSIPSGMIMGFVGENGAGKTTTIKSILNTVKIDGGTIKLLGRTMTDKDTGIREDIGVVLDAANFSGILTPARLAKVMSGIYRQWDQDEYIRLTGKFGLPMNRRLKDFSRGMSMKLAIAAALSHRPKLLILDEATSGLDPVTREEILEVFQEFVEDESRSILMSSHITSDLEKIADFITIIHQGKIILTAPKDELIYNYGIARCRQEQFIRIETADRLCYRKRDFQTDVLVGDRQAFAQKYDGIVVDNVSIDEILLFLVKGER